MTDSKRPPAPVLFAGKEYYRVLTINLESIISAQLAKDSEAWITLLGSFYSMASPYIDCTGLEQNLQLIQNKLATLRASRSLGTFNIKQQEVRVRSEILKFQIELFKRSKDLLVKTGGETSDGIDFERLQGEWN